MALTEDFYNRLASFELYGDGRTILPVQNLMKTVRKTSSNKTGVRFLSTSQSSEGNWQYLFTTNDFVFDVISQVTITVENGVVTVTGIYTITNNGEVDFGIQRCDLCDYYTNLETGKAYAGVIDKTILDNPVTIPANSGVGQVTYEIKFKYAEPTTTTTE